MSSFFVQFGLILFPICAYEIWCFRKAFVEMPSKVPMMGLYGGLTAILCQLMPVSIFGIMENFQCVPIILSILYGKRRAGILSVSILIAFQAVTKQPNLMVSAMAILVYSALPFFICHRFEQFGRGKRLVISLLLATLTLMIELAFLIAYYVITLGPKGLSVFGHYTRMLAVACVVQWFLMSVTFFLLENIIEHGRVRKRHDSLIYYNPLGICAFNIDGQITSVNPSFAALLGYRESELIGTLRASLWKDDASTQGNGIARLETQAEANLDATLLHKDGHLVHVKYTRVPMVDTGNVVGYYALVTDLTAIHAAEQAIRNSDKLSVVGQLAAGVAHEIRNPLSALKGFTQLILSTENPAPYVNIMQDELSRIELIVNELLVLAKPQVMKFSVRDIRQKLLDVIQLLSGQASLNNIDIATEFDDAPVLVECDPNQLKQVFINVLKNAIEATGTLGRVTIALKAQEQSVVVVMRDSGRGIPAHILERLGEPFFSTKETGTGLGLTTCKRMIANHRGHMDITSVVGEGTTVTMVVPRKQNRNLTVVGDLEHTVFAAATIENDSPMPANLNSLAVD